MKTIDILVSIRNFSFSLKRVLLYVFANFFSNNIYTHLDYAHRFSATFRKINLNGKVTPTTRCRAIK